jgi:hypothetical protein
MDKKSKVISGLKEGKNIIQKPTKYFSDSEKHHILQELLSSGCSKREIWEKYTGQPEEHGQLLRWMRQLGYDDSIKTRRPNFTANNDTVMAKKTLPSENPIEDFETLQLKKRIAELESQLKDAQMRAIAFSTMVDIAEREFNIPIRKKYNTKPSKK